MMKRLYILLILLTAAFWGSGQTYLPDNTFGKTFNRILPFYALGIPNDTIAPPVAYQHYPHLAGKDSVLYIWSPSGKRFRAVGSAATSGGGGGSYSFLAPLSNDGGVVSLTSVPWSLLTGKPTTLSGYGITDALNVSDTAAMLSGYMRKGVAGSAGHTHIGADITDGTTWFRNMLFGGTGVVYNNATGVIALDSALVRSWLGEGAAYSFTGPLSESAGTVSITQAGGSTNGYLSAVDWTLFNSKVGQSALNDTAAVLRSLIAASAPTLQQVLTAGNTATLNLTTTGTITGSSLHTTDSRVEFSTLSGYGRGFLSDNSGIPRIELMVGTDGVNKYGYINGNYFGFPISPTISGYTGDVGYIYFKPDGKPYYFFNGTETAFAAGGGTTTNLYNSNGTLTGNRTLAGGGYTLSLSNLGNYSVHSTNGTNGQAYLDMQGYVDLYATNTTTGVTTGFSASPHLSQFDLYLNGPSSINVRGRGDSLWLRAAKFVFNGMPTTTDAAASDDKTLHIDARGRVYQKTASGSSLPSQTGNAGKVLGTDGSAASWKQTTGYYYPEDYGAVGNGTTNDAAAFQSAINAMPSTGGVLYCTPGKTYLLTSAITITKRVKVLGGGWLSSKIITTSTTLDLFTVSAPGASFEDIYIGNTATTTPTAGSAVKCTSGAEYLTFDNTFVDNFYDGINIQSAPFSHFAKVYVWNFVRYGMFIQNTVNGDVGDMSITSCDFTSVNREGVAGIRQESSGGLKISNTKWNWAGTSRMQYAYDGYITSSTVDLLFSNNSFENFTQAAIKLRIASGQNFRFVAINGNQFSSYASAPYVIDIADAKGVAIVGNVFGDNVNSVRLNNVLGYNTNIADVNVFYGNTGTGVIINDGTGEDLTAPTLSGAAVAAGTPSQVDLTFSESVTITASGWSLSASGGAVSVSSVTGSGTTTPKLVLSRSITAGETLALSYDPATGATTDAAGNELSTVSGYSVTNGAGVVYNFEATFTGASGTALSSYTPEFGTIGTITGTPTLDGSGGLTMPAGSSFNTTSFTNDPMAVHMGWKTLGDGANLYLLALTSGASNVYINIVVTGTTAVFRMLKDDVEYYASPSPVDITTVKEIMLDRSGATITLRQKNGDGTYTALYNFPDVGAYTFNQLKVNNVTGATVVLDYFTVQ
jgi:hypothetical protein